MIQRELRPTLLDADQRRRPAAQHTGHMMILTRLAFQPLVFAACLMVLATQVAAQLHPGKPSPVRGAGLAAKLCAECHTSKADDAQRVKADVPTFQEIANLPAQSPELLTGKIMVPRHPMPTMSLSRVEIADVVAYIETFKKPD